MRQAWPTANAGAAVTYALALVCLKRYDEVIAALQSLSGDAAKDVGVVTALATAFADKGDYLIAVNVCERGPVESAVTDEGTATLRYVYAASLAALGKKDSALAAFRRIVTFEVLNLRMAFLGVERSGFSRR